MFHVVYFTTQKHFDYLRMSIQSWLNLPSLRYIGSIEVSVDCLNPLDQRQCAFLTEGLSVPVNFVTTEEPMAHRGLNVVRNELRAFVRIAGNAAQDDWIVKVDSDVLITTRMDAFTYARTCRASMFGNPSQNSSNAKARKKSIQGGVYFLRAGDVRRLTATTLETNSYVDDNPLKCPEDKVITEQMERGGGKIEDRRIAWKKPKLMGLMEGYTNRTFLHFMGDSKIVMEEAFQFLCERKRTGLQ